ncbi:MAG: hypothetical protein ACK4JX_04460 [Flavobacterium sp.]
MAGFDLQLLWDASNNGLSFFQSEFSHVGKKRNALKGFSVRANDDTGSCHVTKAKNGLYYFKDFGTGDKAMNMIDYVMFRDNCDFVQACITLYIHFGLAIPSFNNTLPKPKFSSEVKHEPGYWSVKFHEEILDFKTTKQLFPFADQNIFDSYKFKQVVNYEDVGQKEDGSLWHRTFEASETYPVFGYDCTEFVKLYAPKAPKGDKFLLKHSFVGTKPSRHIFGWDLLLNDVDLPEINYLLERLQEPRLSKAEKSSILDELDGLKLDYVIIATGGSDGMNIACLGYPVIWFNSETETINSMEFAELKKIAKNVVYIPDLDETGVKQAIFLAERYIDLKLLWLPEWLKDENKKDFADWIRCLANEPIDKVKFLFSKMLKGALNFRFWKYSDSGAVQLNEKKMLHFLQLKNIRLYKTPFKSNDSGKEDDGYFINLENNIIKQVFPSDIKRIFLKWVDDNFFGTEVYNKLIRSAFFNQNQLKALPYYEYQKTTTGKEFQYYFFKNQAIKISKEVIEAIPYKDSSRKLANIFVWEDHVIQKPIKLQNQCFETYYDKDNTLRVKVLDNSSKYFKVLIQTSRIFWKKDANETEQDTNLFNINSKNLSPEENALQELHLLNKMYCVGYLLHQYKRASRAWMVMGVDYVSGESVKGSYGGTGKSFLQKAIFHLIKSWNIGAKTLKDNGFPLDGVTPKIKFVLFDDLPPYQDLEYFYNMIADNFSANQKGGVIYNMPFDDSPKVGATTNFAPDMIPSTKRRLLVYHNSDYYHEATDDNNYQFSRKISDDFNCDLFDKDYSESDWNHDFNFMLQCLQFYLKQDQKIEAPISTLVSKNNLMKVGDSYVKFFRELFSNADYLNKWVEKSVIVSLAKEELGSKFVSAQRFSENLKLFVAAHKDFGWGLDLNRKRNSSGNSVPHFYVNTTGAVLVHDQELIEPINNNSNFFESQTDDIPPLNFEGYE